MTTVQAGRIRSSSAGSWRSSISPEKNPLGKHLHVGARGDRDYEVVGIVGDTLYQVGQPGKATMYFPVLSGESEERLTLAVRTSTDPLAFSVPIQKQIAALDPELPVSDVLTMEQIIERSHWAMPA